jgi:hypothetical protein
MLEKNESGYTTDSISPDNSAFVSIGAGYNGSASFSQSQVTSGTEVKTVITDSATGHTATYISDTITLLDGNGNPMTVPITKTVTVEKTTYYDFNIVTKEETVTVIVKKTVTEGSVETITYTKNVTKTAADGTVTTTPEEESDKPLSPDVPNPTTNIPQPQIGGNVLNITYLVSDTSKFPVDPSYTPSGEDESGNAISPTYTFNVTNTTGAAVDIFATILDDSGIIFIISDGTTSTQLEDTEDEQTVQIEGASAS